MKIVFREDKEQEIVFATTIINNIKYRIQFHDHYVCWYVSLSSGKKRRELDIYEDKLNKSRNSWQVVKWVLSAIDQFPYKGRIIIHWADKRRKVIYGRFLLRIGFKLTKFDRQDCYLKNYD